MLKFKTWFAVLAYLSSTLLNEVGLSLFRYFEVGLRVCDIVVNKFVCYLISWWVLVLQLVPITADHWLISCYIWLHVTPQRAGNIAGERSLIVTVQQVGRKRKRNSITKSLLRDFAQMSDADELQWTRLWQLGVHSTTLASLWQLQLPCTCHSYFIAMSNSIARIHVAVRGRRMRFLPCTRARSQPCSNETFMFLAGIAG